MKLLLILLVLLCCTQLAESKRRRKRKSNVEINSNGDQSLPSQRGPGGGIGHQAKRKKRRKRPKLDRETRKIVKEKNKKAIGFAKKNELHRAAKIFEEIVELSPKDSQYLNNLAVTYMRLKLYHLAEKILRRARIANPDDPDPIANLKDLRSYLPDTLPYPPHPPQRHTTRTFLRIPYSDFHLKKYDKYREGSLPFILTGAIDHWKNAYKNWSLEYFAAKYPGTMVEHYSRNMVQETVKPTFNTVEHCVDDMKAESTWYKDKPGVYVQWNMNTEMWREVLLDAVSGGDKEGTAGESSSTTTEAAKTTTAKTTTSEIPLPSMFTSDDKWIEQCFENDKMTDGFLIGTHWRMLLIGSKNAGMFNHRDILRSSSFQAQLVGKKRWHLCGPSQDMFMYKAGDINTFAPNYEEFPKAVRANCIDDWIVPGELIFYGKDWWHHTEVLPDANDGRPCVSITGTLVDANNHKAMVQELSRECGFSHEGKEKRIHIFNDACNRMKKCFDIWRKEWGSSDTNSDTSGGEEGKGGENWEGGEEDEEEELDWEE